ncbi:hypothetical protein AB0L40_23425 [Patulibacter sp. NPDC049589]|uniref:hypothetical protein n=1 Tax=Patulibacter sp. NPDC049589 TaxID=3154731 RepID=UPI0034358D10
MAALLAATLGLSACGAGSSDDKAQNEKASQQLQKEGIDKKAADELVETSQRLKDSGFSDADAKKLKADVAAAQHRATALQQQLVDITKKVQSGKLSAAAGTKQIGVVRDKIQRQALAAAETLEKAGALPPSAKKQVDAARKQLESGAAQK